ncbi:MAG: PAS domain S-box protein [Bacteroidales bacterium]
MMTFNASRLRDEIKILPGLISRIMAFSVIAIGIIVLLGRAVASNDLATLWLGGEGMKTETATCLLLAGFSILILQNGRVGWVIIARVFSTVILFTGLVTYFFFIRKLFFEAEQERLEFSGLFTLFRYFSFRSFSLIAIGTILLLVSIDGKRFRLLAIILSSIILAISGFGIIELLMKQSDLLEIMFVGQAYVTPVSVFLAIIGVFLSVIRVGNKGVQIEDTIIAGIILFIVVAIITAFLSNSRLTSLKLSRFDLENSFTRRADISSILTSTLDLQAANREYILNGDSTSLKEYKAINDELNLLVNRIANDIYLKEHYNKNILDLSKLVTSRISFADSLNTLRNDGKSREAMLLIPEGKKITEKIRVLIRALKKSELDGLIKIRDLQISEETRIYKLGLLNFLIQIILISGVFIVVRWNLKLRKEKITDATIEKAILEKSILEKSVSVEKGEERFRSTLENMIEGCQIIDFNYRYIFVNEVAATQARMKRSRLEGRVMTNIFPGIEQTPMFMLLKRCMQERIAAEIDNLFEYHDKTTSWFRLKMIPVPEGLFIMSNDITELRRVEEKIRESEAQYRYLFENNPVPMWIYDLETWNFIEVNEAAVEKYGYSKERFLSMNLKDIRPPEEIEALTRNIKGTDSKLAFSGPWRHIKSDGTVIYVEILSHSINFKNKEARLVLAYDITDKHETDQKLKVTMNRLDVATKSAGIGIWDWDIPGNQIVWDEQMYRLYGRENDGKLSSYEIWISSLHPDDRELSDEMSRKALAGEKDYDTSFRVVWPDGSVHLLKANARVFRNERGAPVHMIGVNYDITKREPGTPI